MSNDNVLSSVVAEAGYNATDILQKANSPVIKKELRSRTVEAKEKGLCGVPSYRVFRRKLGSADEWSLAGDMVWGQDDAAVVEDMICGSDGEGVATVEEGINGQGKSKL